jgi:hypothetical protein
MNSFSVGTTRKYYVSSGFLSVLVCGFSNIGYVIFLL